MPNRAQLPEVVRDFQLETEFLDEPRMTIHTTRWNQLNSSAREEWVQDRVLGHGGYGVVCLERNTSTDGSTKLRAVKQIKRSNGVDYVRELEALAKFSSDKTKYRGFFVKAYGWYQSPAALFIAMEYCKHGSLADYLHQHRTLPENQSRRIASQVLGGLELMHEEGFAHRDLKPANILIWRCPPEQWWVKICDLGLTKRVEAMSGSRTVWGTVGFMPPELTESDADSRNVDPFSADMWCYGETVFRLLTGQQTFRDNLALRKYQLDDSRFPVQALWNVEASDAAIKFLSSVMKPRPSARLTAPEALGHEWLKLQVLDEQSDLVGPQSDAIPAVPLLDIPTPDQSTQASGEWSTRPQNAVATYGLHHPPVTPQSTASQPNTWRHSLARDSGISSAPSGMTQRSEDAKIPTEHRQSKRRSDGNPKLGTRKETEKVPRGRLSFFRDLFSKEPKKPRPNSLTSEVPRKDSTDSSPTKPRFMFYDDLPSSGILHCSNFPDGTIFFYSRECIYLYNKTGAELCSITPSQGPKWSQTLRPTARSCANQAMFLASDSYNTFKGTIHAIVAEDPPRIHTQRVAFETRLTAVEKISFSPDGRMIAVSCVPDESPSSQVQVRLYKLQERRESSGSILSSASEQSSTRLVAHGDILADAGKVCGVKESLDLLFSSNGQILYHVCLLKRDPKNLKPRVQVNIFQTSTRDPSMDIPDWTCIIHDTNSEFLDFFMQGVVCFNTKPGFMCITHEDSIVLQVLRGRQLHGQTIPIQNVFRIRSVLLSSDDERVVMLTTPTGNYLEIYGGFLTTLHTPKQLPLSKKIRYDPERDNAFIREENGKIEVLITSCNDRGTYIVDVRELFRSE